MGGLNGLAEEGSVHFKPTSKFQSKLAAKIHPPTTAKRAEECQFFCLLIVFWLRACCFQGGLRKNSHTHRAKELKQKFDFFLCSFSSSLKVYICIVYLWGSHENYKQYCVSWRHQISFTSVLIRSHDMEPLTCQLQRNTTELIFYVCFL